MTDSNSGITVREGERLGVAVLPMPVHIDGRIYFEGLDLSQDEFYRRMLAGAEVATSQPAPGDLEKMWKTCLAEYDEVVYIPMSSGLSGSCEVASVLAEDYGGRVQVVDNHRISLTQRFSVRDAMRLAEQGLGAAEIKRVLEEQSMDACIYITVDTLKYLKKGGRVTGAEAVAGTMLNIKPVMEIRGEKLTVIGKTRGMKAARKMMIERVKADLQGRLKDLREAGHMQVLISYSQVSDATLESWRAEVLAAFPEEGKISGDPLALSIACHTGPGALGVGAVRI